MEQKEYSIKKVLKNSSIYSLTSVLQKAISFFLLPIYTAYLTPGDYGLVALISSFFGFVALLITFALDGAISRYYFVYKNDEKKVKEFLGTIVVGIIINCILWFLLILILNNIITRIFLKNIEFFPYIFIASLTTVTAPIYSIYQSILQIKQDAKQYSTNSMLYFFFALSLNLLFIAGLKLGATGLLLANAIPSIVFSILAIIMLIGKKHISIAFKWEYMFEALRYSIPLIPHLLSGTIANYISKNILNIKTNLGNIGLFELASQFGLVLDIILNSINSAFYPMVYDTLDNYRENEWKIIKTTTLVFKSICFLGMGLTLFSKEIVIVMTSNESFYVAWKAIPIISLGVLFQSLYSFYGTLLFYNRKSTKYIGFASLSGNFVHIAFSFWFTSFLGYLTPAIAMLLQRLITFVIVYLISRKFEPVKYELLKMMSIILLFVTSSSIGLAPDIVNTSEGLNIIKILWKTIIFVIAVIILFYEDRLYIKNIIEKRLKGRKNNE